MIIGRNQGLIALLLSPVLFFVSTASQAESISLSPQHQAVADGASTRIEVKYHQGTGASGVGLRVHYNSQSLDFTEVVSVLGRDLIGVQKPVADGNDYDGDPNTDSYILVAWADVNNDGWLLTEDESLLVLSFDKKGAASTSLHISTSDKSKNLQTDGAVATIGS